eukprot:TRINITY_DN109778_c0_g1_i1.p1 TRINITY_DN109778_c0_g1~~TRINITY_DN109778_c0_g1_i1.p1  ORF type:complete len:658 (-),score=149.76 TRINITY_DN109778_c0_g1_i1:48-1997(-)
MSLDIESFFASLPDGEFEAWELGLRDALITSASSARQIGLPGGRFPLHAWIARRLGGDLGITKDVQGQCEVLLLNPGAVSAAGASPLAAETFLSRLPEDSFTPEEGALRESIYDFLAAWKRQDLATLAHVRGNAKVKACCKAFLPPTVSLEEWMEFRIGEEIDLKKDEKGNATVVLSETATQLVKAKFAELNSKSQAAQSRMVPVLPKPVGGTPILPPGQVAGPVAQDPPGPPHVAGVQGKGSLTAADWNKQMNQQPKIIPFRMPAGKGAPIHPAGPVQPGGLGKGKQVAMSKEEWLENLPQEELGVQEVELRKNLLEFLGSWQQVDRHPSIYDVMKDPKISKSRSALLPPNVSLRDWIDWRIGGEIDLRSTKSGMIEVLLRGAEDAGDDAAEDHAFFATLPEDALNAQEYDLRQILITVLQRQGEITLQKLVANAVVSASFRKFVPAEIKLEAWIDRRVGGEIEVDGEIVRLRGSSSGQEQAGSSGAAGKQGKAVGKGAKTNSSVVSTKGAGKGASKESRAAASQIVFDNFFNSLPSDSFTPEEESLRDAILLFMEHWTQDDFPPLSKALLDDNVRECKIAVLPPGNSVSLKDWIEHRLGSELVITRDARGTLVIGIAGEDEEIDAGGVKREPDGEAMGEGPRKFRKR